MSNHQTTNLQSRLRKAWQQGYTTGRTGAESASPPFTITPFNEAVIREWRAGHRMGLNVHRQQVRLEAKIGGIQ